MYDYQKDTQTFRVIIVNFRVITRKQCNQFSRGENSATNYPLPLRRETTLRTKLVRLGHPAPKRSRNPAKICCCSPGETWPSLFALRMAPILGPLETRLFTTATPRKMAATRCSVRNSPVSGMGALNAGPFDVTRIAPL